MVCSRSRKFLNYKFYKINPIYVFLLKKGRSQSKLIDIIGLVVYHQFPLIPCLNLRKSHKNILVQFKYKVISPIFLRKKNFFFFKKYFAKC